MIDRGVVYVATKLDRYVEEAFLSAESVKRQSPNLPITLFTDRADHPLCATSCFDAIESASSATGYASTWAAGLLDRLNCLQRTPYRRTLHIDTDTRVLTDRLPELFDLLEDVDVGMVPTAADDSYSRRHYGRPMFNGGLILYRRNEATWTWLADWIELSERYFKIAGDNPLPDVAQLAHVANELIRRELLSNDQTSLAEILSPDVNRLGLALKSLDYSWNYRHSRLPENNREPVKILHSPTLKLTTHADILAVAYAWDRAGQSEAAERLYTYVAEKQMEGLPARARKLWPWRKRRAAPPEEWATQRLRKADLHLRYGQGDKAIELLGAELAEDQNSAYALTGHARVALRLGQTDNAVELAEQAVALLPSSTHARVIHGAALIAAGRHADAVAPLEMAANRGSPDAAFHLGQAWLNLENYAKAAHAYRRALELNPGHKSAENNLMPALLGARRYGDAVELADRALSARPWHVSALAFKSVALAELGRGAEERALSDLDRFVECGILSPPAGYGSIVQFNHALINTLTREPSLQRDPREHATRLGWHSKDLAESNSPAIKALNGLILEAVERRISAITTKVRPFEKACPQSYRLSSWTVIMEEGGHQIPHIHSSAWLSGVYYVEVPPEIAPDDPDHSGWLSFGRGENRWHRPETRTVEKFVHPKPGLLITFPSFFWHGTQPLRSRRRRISYAFDIVPI